MEIIKQAVRKKIDCRIFYSLEVQVSRDPITNSQTTGLNIISLRCYRLLKKISRIKVD